MHVVYCSMFSRRKNSIKDNLHTNTPSFSHYSFLCLTLMVYKMVIEMIRFLFTPIIHFCCLYFVWLNIFLRTPLSLLIFLFKLFFYIPCLRWSPIFALYPFTNRIPLLASLIAFNYQLVFLSIYPPFILSSAPLPRLVISISLCFPGKLHSIKTSTVVIYIWISMQLNM